MRLALLNELEYSNLMVKKPDGVKVLGRSTLSEGLRIGYG